MSKQYTAVAIIVLTLLFPSVASARQWVTITRNPQVSVDVDSIKGEGATRSFWNEVVYNEDKGLSYPKYRSIKSLVFVDCETSKIGILRQVSYNRDGDVVGDIGDSDQIVPNSLDSVIPDSIGESTLTYVCKLRSSTGGWRYTPGYRAANKTISQQQAIALVNQWLEAKKQIFGPPFNQKLIEELTTGSLRNDLTKSDGPISWLKSNKAYYRYRTQKINEVNLFSAGLDRAAIKLVITEESAFYQNGQINLQESGTKMHRVRYQLERVNNTWKIADYSVLD